MGIDVFSCFAIQIFLMFCNFLPPILSLDQQNLGIATSTQKSLFQN